jgi:hypothetical protein
MRGVHHHGLGHVGGAVAAVEGQVARRVADPVAVDGVVPDQRAAQALRVGVDEQLVRIETMALFRRIGPIHAIPVTLRRAHVREVAVPGLVGVFR